MKIREITSFQSVGLRQISCSFKIRVRLFALGRQILRIRSQGRAVCSEHEPILIAFIFLYPIIRGRRDASVTSFHFHFLHHQVGAKGLAANPTPERHGSRVNTRLLSFYCFLKWQKYLYVFITIIVPD